MLWKRTKPENAYQGKWKFIKRISLTILATNWHLIPVFPPPHYIRLREALSFTCQGDVCSFSHNHVVARHRFHDNRRNCKCLGNFYASSFAKRCESRFWYFTDNLEVTFSGSHGIGVDLTHVPSPVGFLNLSYVKIPTSVVIMGEHDSGVLSNDVVMNAENCLSIHPHPRHLHEHERKFTALNYSSIESCLNLKPNYGRYCYGLRWNSINSISFVRQSFKFSCRFSPKQEIAKSDHVKKLSLFASWETEKRKEEEKLITKRYKNVESKPEQERKTNKENFKRMPRANPIKLLQENRARRRKGKIFVSN